MKIKIGLWLLATGYWHMCALAAGTQYNRNQMEKSDIPRPIRHKRIVIGKENQNQNQNGKPEQMVSYWNFLSLTKEIFPYKTFVGGFSGTIFNVTVACF